MPAGWQRLEPTAPTRWHARRSEPGHDFAALHAEVEAHAHAEAHAGQALREATGRVRQCEAELQKYQEELRVAEEVVPATEEMAQQVRRHARLVWNRRQSLQIRRESLVPPRCARAQICTLERAESDAPLVVEYLRRKVRERPTRLPLLHFHPSVPS